MANINVLVSAGDTELSASAYESLQPLLDSADFREVSHWKSADLRLVLGGDGSVLHEARKDVRRKPENRQPILGLKAGNPRSKGMLLNEVDFSDLESIADLMRHHILHRMHYLKIMAENNSGKSKQAYAFNDVNFLRTKSQTGAYKILINGRERMARAMGDGLLLSTPQGSTAYNLSVGGAVASTQEALVLTGISSKNLKSVMLPQSDTVEIEVLEPQKRPQMLESDGRTLLRNVVSAQVQTALNHYSDLAFNPELTFADKLIAEAMG